MPEAVRGFHVIPAAYVLLVEELGRAQRTLAAVGVYGFELEQSDD